MWIFWALFSALCAATRRTQEKKLIHQLHYLSLAFAIQLLGLPVVLLTALLRHGLYIPAHLGMRFWLPAIVVSAVTYPLNSYLYLKAVKTGELSKVLPIQSLWPIFSLIPAWITLHERPTGIAVFGVILTVLGVYSLGLKGRRLHHPLQPFKEDRASLYMLLSVLTVTTAAIFEKVAVKASGPTFYSLVSSLTCIVTLFCMMYVQKVNQFSEMKRLSRTLTSTGSLQATSYITYLLAISTGPIAYVSALRSTNILVGSVLGVTLHREALTKPKIISFCLILLGGITLALGA